MLNTPHYLCKADMHHSISKMLPFILLPILWLMHTIQTLTHSRRKEDPKEWRAKRLANWNAKSWVARLPPLPFSKTNTEELTNISIQSQSLFFSKLPIELRLIVYDYALSGKKLRFELSNEATSEKLFYRLKCRTARQITAFPKSCKLA